jgi:hypothetical protein
MSVLPEKTHILEVLCSKLRRGSGNLAEVFLGFPQPLQTNSEVVPQFRQRLFKTIYFSY